MRRLLLLFLLALAGVSGGSSEGRAEESPEAKGAGVVVQFRGASDRVDLRRARLLALRVPAGEPATPFLEAGPFEATFQGALSLRLRSRLRFRAQGRGALQLRIAGEVVLETRGEDLSVVQTEEARFGKGDNRVELTYRSPADGDAWFRLEWAGSGFEWEPVPPQVLRAPENPDGLESAEALRRGRELVATGRCLRCHAPDIELPRLASIGMPELAAEAPSLSGAGRRLQGDWMRAWISDPKALRPSAEMPQVLGPERAGRAGMLDDLVAYLASLRETPAGAEGEPASGAERVAEGGERFAALGCIACHLRPDAGPVPPEEDDRIPLRGVAAKWTRVGLYEFLRAPHRDYPWIRMPDLALDSREASALVAFLMDAAAGSGLARSPGGGRGDADAGRTLFMELGCRNCHEAPGEPASKAPALRVALQRDGGNAGCGADLGDGPRYGFPAADRAALARFAAAGAASLGRRSLIEFAERQIRRLQCNACHTYDDAYDRWASRVVETRDLEGDAETEGLDQSRPALTWVGEKLHSSWTERLLAGTLEEKTRPWLAARMPAFPARATLLSVALAAGHGLGPSSAEPVAALASDDLCQTGRTLLGKDGFSCTSCHDVGSELATSRFEFGTPNLALAHERIRPDYYARWMYDPLRVEPSSRMPRYASDGASPFHEFLDGDIRRQYEAIRLYLGSIAE